MIRIAVIGLIGESVFLPVEHFHIGGETLVAKHFHTEPGGKGFNQAVAAARFGANVSFLAAVGRDGYGEVAEAFLRNEGICPFLIRKEQRTAYAVIMTDSDGRNRVTEYLGAELCVHDAWNFSDEIRNADILLLSNEVPEAVNKVAAEIADECGVRIILNPAPARDLSEELRQKVWLFTPNEHETNGLDNCSNVIVTLGENGSYLRMKQIHISADSVDAVDTTGAGDTFNGVLAVMLAEGRSLEDSAKIANLAAGKSVMVSGAVVSIPYRKDIAI